MITPLPTPPSRQDPTNFATRADEFLGALPAFATQANALEAENAAAATAAANAVLTSKLNNTNPSYTGTLTGGTGVIDIGSGQFVKDASGNVGIGVTPVTGGGKLQLSNGENITFQGTYGNTVTNAVYTDTWRYITTAGAANYFQNAGAHTWLTAPSGTAGSPITFGQAMALDASSNLKIAGKYYARRSTGALELPVLCYSDGVDGSALTGNVGDNVAVGTVGVGDLLFVVASSAVGRFDTNGNLLVGSTANGGPGSLFVVGKTGTHAIVARDSGSANYLFVGQDSVGNNSFQMLTNGNCQNTNNSYGAISDLKLKENIVDVTPKLAKLLQVRIVNYTLKADPNKTKLMGVIAQELEQISPGLIEETPDYEEVTKTREVEVPAVEAVLDAEGNEVTPVVPATMRTEEYTERVPTGTVTKSVKYSVFVPMLIKGMQEQQAQIETMQSQLDTQNHAIALLTARLEALETK